MVAKKNLKKISGIENIAVSIARESLLGYIQFTFPNFIINWHHRVLVEKLEALLEGRIKRLMVFMPPRHSKSEIVSRRFPTFVLGRNPDTKIIMTSYSASLAHQMNRDCQGIMRTRQYQLLFPETVLPQSNVETKGPRQGGYLCNSELTQVVGRQGSILAAGVGGGITGHGFDIGIVDDPIKNWQEAHSPVYRETVWNWFVTVFLTRQNTQDAKILITLTRWHEDDLAGRILDRMKTDPNFEKYEVLSLPAIQDGQPSEYDIRQQGEVLWKGRFDLDYMMQRKKEGEYKFNALFQQRPSSPEGNIVSRDWWQYYDEKDMDISTLELIIQSWDMNFKDTKSGSFVVGQVWGLRGADAFLLHQVRGRWDFPATIEQFRMVDKQQQTSAKLVEDKANGPAVISTLKHEIPGILPIQVEENKVLRAQAVSYLIKSGNVYLPKNALWVDEFIDEWANFPNGANDDQVDATTQALKFLFISSQEQNESDVVVLEDMEEHSISPI